LLISQLKINSVRDLFALDEERLHSKALKGLSEDQVADVMEFAERFPFLDVTITMSSSHPEATEEAQDGLHGPAVFPEGDLITFGYHVRRLDLHEFRERTKELKNEHEKRDKIQKAADAARRGVLKNKKAKKGKKAAAAEMEAELAAQVAAAREEAKLNAPDGETPAENGAADAPLNGEELEGKGSINDVQNKNIVRKADDGEDESDDDADEEEEEEERELDDDELWDVNTDQKKESHLDALDGQHGVPVLCPRYPHPKREWWWCFLGYNKNDCFVRQASNVSPIAMQKLVNLEDEKEVSGGIWVW
jgi:hypothetical protein